MAGTEERPDADLSAIRTVAKQQALQWVGLAIRARKAVIGADAVMKAVQSRKARLVLVTEDAGANMAKKYRDKCAFYDIPLVVWFDRWELGIACGKPQTVAVAFMDPGFAAKMEKYYGEFSGGEAFGETSSV
ncbi:ribosomal L7Ae/L30e/S12e/Gadd45 family protein [Alicyclobacillus pomorum]|jgi:ribosomal protein L7Ae-like RNA K-turn-binding protein|nr:ribosomal L7Ae/L30e/S12e/Gadd45 family protein [Alicyclobacillus pomorum]